MTMMKNNDVRWIQRLYNYKRALAQLERFINQEHLNELEQQGLIQAFEYTHELAWKVLKDYLQAQGVQNIHGSRNATREAFNLGIIHEGEVWMNMIKDRNQTSHTYNQDTAERIVNNIQQKFFSLFCNLSDAMQQLEKDYE
jgi:nucleotidyltransferase substrate binding protein (TIGR01987 family)